MESVVIVVPREYDHVMRERLASTPEFVQTSLGKWASENKTGRVYISVDDYVLGELEPDDLAVIRNKMHDPVFYVVDFGDMAFCRYVLEILADDPMVLVDNDHGLILTGSEFVGRMRFRPDWDWRLE